LAPYFLKDFSVMSCFPNSHELTISLHTFETVVCFIVVVSNCDLVSYSCGTLVMHVCMCNYRTF